MEIDPQRLRQLSPKLFGLGAVLPTRIVARRILDAHLWNGDSRAAVVLSVQRPLVATYSSDLDAIVVLRFDRWLRGRTPPGRGRTSPR